MLDSIFHREELATPLSEGPSGRFLKPLIGNRKMDCKRKGELTSVRDKGVLSLKDDE